MRYTQPKRYSRSPGQHDPSVRIQRLKRPLMGKVWLPKLWASLIPLIWTCGRPNSGKGARRNGPRNASCADKYELYRLSSEVVLGILSSYPRKPMNTKLWDNFVPHNMDTEFALFGVRTWEIWCQQGSRRHEGEAPGRSRRLPQVPELPRRCPRPCPSHHG
jgi:hypothetical protein